MVYLDVKIAKKPSDSKNWQLSGLVYRYCGGSVLLINYIGMSELRQRELTDNLTNQGTDFLKTTGMVTGLAPTIPVSFELLELRVSR